jgi:hypothetical protein
LFQSLSYVLRRSVCFAPQFVEHRSFFGEKHQAEHVAPFEHFPESQIQNSALPAPINP